MTERHRPAPMSPARASRKVIVFPDLSHLRGRDRRRIVTPASAYQASYLCYLPVREAASEAGHRKLRWCRLGVRHLRSLEDDVYH